MKTRQQKCHPHLDQSNKNKNLLQELVISLDQRENLKYHINFVETQMQIHHVTSNNKNQYLDAIPMTKTHPKQY